MEETPRPPTSGPAPPHAQTYPAPRRASGAKILIIDDHSVVRRGLAHLLRQEPGLQVCAEAESAREGVLAIRNTQPDLAIIDLSLEDIGGIELIKQIKALYPGLPMMVLSMHDEMLYAERVLRAGALGYVMKSEATEKLVTAIRTVLRGEVYVSGRISARILGRVMGTHADISGPPLEVLSDRELEVFELLGRGLGTRAISERMCVSIKTTEAHRESIKNKLNLKSATELVHLAAHWVIQEETSPRDAAPAVTRPPPPEG